MLIERERVLDQLSTCLEKVGAGTGSTVLVSGEAGIGKTSVLTHFVSQHPNCRVLWGGCEALFSPRPLGPLYDMAPELNVRLQQLMGLEGNRNELFAALLEQLQNQQVTTVMVFEDLHWADAATLDLIKFLARRIHLTSTLLLLTYRDDEIDLKHPLRSVLGDMPVRSVTRIPLATLTESAVIGLAKQANRNPDGLYKITGGNPFFVTEAIRENANPESIRDAVLARISRLPNSARELVNMIALAPSKIEISLIDELLKPKYEDVLLALSSGLIKADRNFYFFRHELARISVEEALPAPIALMYHSKILAYLICFKGTVSMARLVHHAAGAKDSDAVLKYAPQAAAEAKSCGSNREAAELYYVSLLHANELPPAERGTLYEKRAYMCYLTDQIDNAIEARLAALSIWRGLGNIIKEGHTLRWLSRLNWFAGHNGAAKAYADRAVQLLEKQPDLIELAWAKSNLSQLYMLNGQIDDAVYWGNGAIELALQEGNHEIHVHALNNVGTTLYERGDSTGKDLLEKSLNISLEMDYGEHAARAYVNLATMAVKKREYNLANKAIIAAEAYFAARDLDSWLNYLMAIQIRMEFELGQWDSAADLAGRLLARQRVANISRIPALTIIARLRMLRGDPGAEEILNDVTILAMETGELQRLAPVAIAQAEAAWIRGDVSAMHDVVLKTLDLARQRKDRFATGDIAFWINKLGLDHGITDLSEVAPAHALYFSGDWAGGAEIWRQMGCPYEQALYLLDGDESDINEGLNRLEKLGAAGLVKRCRNQFRQSGIRGIERGPRAATTKNFAGLTSRELEVLSHLTLGMSNAEIANQLSRSEKTIEHHISAILLKLQVRSRGEAVAMASKFGLSSVLRT